MLPIFVFLYVHVPLDLNVKQKGADPAPRFSSVTNTRYNDVKIVIVKMTKSVQQQEIKRKIFKNYKKYYYTEKQISK